MFVRSPGLKVASAKCVPKTNSSTSTATLKWGEGRDVVVPGFGSRLIGEGERVSRKCVMQGWAGDRTKDAFRRQVCMPAKPAYVPAASCVLCGRRLPARPLVARWLPLSEAVLHPACDRGSPDALLQKSPSRRDSPSRRRGPGLRLRSSLALLRKDAEAEPPPRARQLARPLVHLRRLWSGRQVHADRNDPTPSFPGPGFRKKHVDHDCSTVIQCQADLGCVSGRSEWRSGGRSDP